MPFHFMPFHFISCQFQNEVQIVIWNFHDVCCGYSTQEVNFEWNLKFSDFLNQFAIGEIDEIHEIGEIVMFLVLPILIW
jgi:hypothetical protein